MASEVDVCNQALVLIGHGVIASLNEDSDAALACRTLYDPARKATLAAHPWNFASVRDELAQDEEAPVFGYDYSYTLPPTSLAVWEMEDQETYPWKVESGALLTDNDECKILFIEDVDDPARFSAMFNDALALNLAARLCVPLTAKRGSAADLKLAYDRAIQAARTADGFEGMPPENDYNRYSDVRNE